MRKAEVAKANQRAYRAFGIPCCLRTAEMQEAVQFVLQRIRDSFPNDFDRLSRKVRRIVPLSKREARTTRYLGRWVPDDLDAWYLTTLGGDPWQYDPELTVSDESFAAYLEGKLPPEEDVCGIVKFREGDAALDFDRVAVVAHEFGHACTRRKDVVRRKLDPLGDVKLERELAADWYAYRWGFRRHMANLRRQARRYWPDEADQYEYGPGFEWEHAGVGRCCPSPNLVLNVIPAS